MSSQETVKPKDIKQCCARLYESDLAKILLGDSFHPGGVALTERLGTLLGLTAASRVLDIASGKGTSARFMAEHFGCEVVGIDYGVHNVEQGNTVAAAKGLGKRVSFQTGDAEHLPYADSFFDAVICECQKYRPICAARSFRVKGLESNRLAGIFRIHGSNLCTRPEVSDSNQVNSARAS